MKLTLLMESEPHPCGYLPGQTAVLQETVAFELDPAEFRQLIDLGFRRFGRELFRPICHWCQKCIPIRILVKDFVPNRSQKRNFSKNISEFDLQIEIAKADEKQLERLAQLHQQFHAMQTREKSWPQQGNWDSARFVANMAEQPFPVEVWNYIYKGAVVGSGYVDPLPDGLSAIYFIHNPEVRPMGLGIFNVLSMIEGAKARGLDYLYLGFWVPGSSSMAYKATFSPSEILTGQNLWTPFPSTTLVDPPSRGF